MKNIKVLSLPVIYPLIIGFILTLIAINFFYIPAWNAIFYILAFSFSMIIWGLKMTRNVIFINKNSKTIIIGIFFSFLFIVMALLMYDGNISSYFRFSPLYDASINNRWHKDTAFNLSLIQSILNFGYPSIALDGHPFTAYHVFSHYIDALLIKISGLDVYQSYGFTSLVKFVFLMYLTFLFTISVLKTDKNATIYFLVFSPLIISTGHQIISHALWAPSFLLIISFPYVYSIISRTESVKLVDFIKIIIISILLCFGKISTGFGFIIFIFSCLLIKEYKNIAFYLSSLFLLFFIFIYNKFINYSYGIDSKIDFSLFNMERIISIINELHYNKALIVLLIVQLVFYKIYKNKLSITLFLATFLSLLIILFLTSTFASFNFSDRAYFFLGLYSIAILFLLNMAGELSKNNIDIEKKFLPICLTFLISFFISQPVFSLANLSLNGLKAKYDYFMNHKLKEFIVPSQNIGGLVLLNNQVNYLTSIHNIKRNEMAIFIPRKEILENVIKPNNNQNIFYTMNIYAATGVQIINGLIGKNRAYGFANYTNQSSISEFISYNEKCKALELKLIIKISSYDKGKYELVYCNNIRQL